MVVSLLAAVLLALSGGAPALALAAALGLGAMWTMRPQPAGRVQLRTNHQGRLELGQETAPEAARAEFVSAYLVVLVSRSYTLAVWSDALPPVSFRRLCALARWASGQPPD